METIQLTPNGALALQFLQGQDGPVTGSDIAAATGLNPQGIHGVLNGLVKKGLVAKADSVTRPFTNKAGLTEEKSYVTYIVTDLGSEFVAA